MPSSAWTTSAFAPDPQLHGESLLPRTEDVPGYLCRPMQSLTLIAGRRRVFPGASGVALRQRSEIIPEIGHDSLHPTVVVLGRDETELGEDAVHMGLDGPARQVEPGGYGRVGQPLRHES